MAHCPEFHMLLVTRHCQGSTSKLRAMQVAFGQQSGTNRSLKMGFVNSACTVILHCCTDNSDMQSFALCSINPVPGSGYFQRRGLGKRCKFERNENLIVSNQEQQVKYHVLKSTSLINSKELLLFNTFSFKLQGPQSYGVRHD